MIDTIICDHDTQPPGLPSRQPVVLKGLCARWPACRVWSISHLAAVAPDLIVPVKTYRHDGSAQVSRWRLHDYAEFVTDSRSVTPGRNIPYCHDVPLLLMIPSLMEECRPFPTDLLPRFYRKAWWKYAQAFVGPADTVTPLHFDTLLTHNLFFQIVGRKQFRIVTAGRIGDCGRRGWRWCEVDPEHPDYERFPEFKRVMTERVVVEAGDALYLPPGTMHHVRALDESISFNIDFHTKRSVLAGLAAAVRGMPAESVYYNGIAACGLICGISEEWVFKRYRRYLDYVS